MAVVWTKDGLVPVDTTSIPMKKKDVFITSTPQYMKSFFDMLDDGCEKVYITRMGFENMKKTKHYTQEDGNDLIDRWAKEKTPDGFRAGMGMIIEKYISRLGRKDNTTILDDVRKICDYAQRWYKYEQIANAKAEVFQCAVCLKTFYPCQQESLNRCPYCKSDQIKFGKKKRGFEALKEVCKDGA